MWMIAPMLVLGLASGTPAQAGAPEQVFWTTRDVLKDFFRSSERVSFVELSTAEAAAELEALLGYVPGRAKYPVFVARTGDRVDGYAVIDEELGQHQQITFAVKLDAQVTVERMEVMVYREGYGGEIREGRFRKQFAGKKAEPPADFGDVVAISGATLSSKAMARGVRRAAAVAAVAARRLPSLEKRRS